MSDAFSLLRTQSVRNNKPFAMRMENDLRYITALTQDSDDCLGRQYFGSKRVIYMARKLIVFRIQNGCASIISCLVLNIGVKSSTTSQEKISE